jgi:hypothetical protein
MERKRAKVMPQEENKGVTEQRKERVIKHGKRKAKAPDVDADMAPIGKPRNRGGAVDKNVKEEAKRRRDDDECARSERTRIKVVLEEEVQNRMGERRERVAKRAERKAKAGGAGVDHASIAKTRKRDRSANKGEGESKRVKRA